MIRNIDTVECGHNFFDEKEDKEAFEDAKGLGSIDVDGDLNALIFPYGEGSFLGVKLVDCIDNFINASISEDKTIDSDAILGIKKLHDQILDRLKELESYTVHDINSTDD